MSRRWDDEVPGLDEVNPHRALWLSETAVDPSEKAWLRWVKQTEVALGVVSLDGTQWEDGYSLDYALMLFEADYTPSEAAEEFRVNMADIASTKLGG